MAQTGCGCGTGGNEYGYALILVLSILLVIIGAARLVQQFSLFGGFYFSFKYATIFSNDLIYLELVV